MQPSSPPLIFFFWICSDPCIWFVQAITKLLPVCPPRCLIWAARRRQATLARSTERTKVPNLAPRRRRAIPPYSTEPTKVPDLEAMEAITKVLRV